MSQQSKFTIHLGDSLEILKSIPPNSLDSLVTDPPAGIGFCGHEWDLDKGGREEWVSWLCSIMKESYRVLKPGAHGFVWALPRTSHWTALAVENAGFQIKDVITHVFGNGFPKNLDVSKAINNSKHIDIDLIYRATAWIRSRRDDLGLTNRKIDEIAGVRGGACHWTARATSAQPAVPTLERWQRLEKILGPAPAWMEPLLLPAHSEGNRYNENQDKWKGYGTALKPSSEHWLLIQKPITAQNIASNILKFGTGAINIDKSRIVARVKIPEGRMLYFGGNGQLWDFSEKNQARIYKPHPEGRHPANFLLTRGLHPEECPADTIDKEGPPKRRVSDYFKVFHPEKPFIYFKRSTTSERGDNNTHPTVKPLSLMRYLVGMVTPTGGSVLDPFMGSGTTGVASLLDGFSFLGIEQNSEFFEISQKRLAGVTAKKEEK